LESDIDEFMVFCVRFVFGWWMGWIVMIRMIGLGWVGWVGWVDDYAIF
jgi:hypothetical protein